MYEHTYFPNVIVDTRKDILINLCFQIESQKSKNIEELYKLTQVTTNKFNDLD